MTWARRRWLPLTALAGALGLLIASIAWTSGAGGGQSPNGIMMGPGGVMGPSMGMAGDGPVNDIDRARGAADRLADRWGLTVGEVMQFDNGFYVELADPSGDLATEVLVDPRTGTVRLEFGPAMMWNTAYGTHSGRAAEETTVGSEEARGIADEWLADNRPGEDAAEPDVFPGYYTMHTLDHGQITGMLSVSATDGAVWYHSWHGGFIAMAEPAA